MGIFDIFKKKQEKTTLKFEGIETIENFVKNKKQELSNQEKEIVFVIKQELADLIIKFKENLVILEKVDLKDKKVEDRIKFIVRENFDKYLIQFKKLIETLDDIKITNYEESIARLNHVFGDFEKRTHINFEKSTFLIGKELGSVKDTISHLFNNINKMLKEKKDFVESYKVIDFIEKRLSEIKTLEETKKEIHKTIEDNNKKIKSKNQEENLNQKEIFNIQNSPEYKSELDEQKELEKQNELIEKEVYLIKQSIDFKALSTIFHSNDKYMKIINDNRHNFKEYFLKDPHPFIKILNEANLNSCDSKIDDLIEKNKEFEKLKHSIHNTHKQKAKITSIENHIKTILSDIDFSNEEIIKENKRLEKLEENKKEILDLIKNELDKINITLVY